MKLTKNTFKRFLGEFTGTAMLMCIGCMSCVNDHVLFRRTHLMISLCFGFAYTICMHCFGCVSGAHINPSVTLANFIMGLIEWDVAIVYVIVQILGAFFGFYLVVLFTPSRYLIVGPGVCNTVVHDTITQSQALGIEIITSAMLIAFCCAMWDKRNSHQGDSISARFGLLVAVLMLSSFYYTGGSFNFARTLAPAVYHKTYSDLWVYLTSQLISGIIVPLIYRFVLSDDELDE